MSKATPWLHNEGIVNGIRLHWVEAKPPLRRPAPASAPTSNSSHYRDHQTPPSRPLVVLLHGFPEFWYAWRHQLIFLGAADFRVVAPDLRGYNFSEKPVSGYDLQTLSSDIVDLIRLLLYGHHRTAPATPATTGTAATYKNVAVPGSVGGTPPSPSMVTTARQQQSAYLPLDFRPPPVYLVGHDWGGVIAWVVARRFPDIIDKLVLLNTPPMASLVPPSPAFHPPPPPRSLTQNSILQSSRKQGLEDTTPALLGTSTAFENHSPLSWHQRWSSFFCYIPLIQYTWPLPEMLLPLNRSWLLARCYLLQTSNCRAVFGASAPTTCICNTVPLGEDDDEQQAETQETTIHEMEDGIMVLERYRDAMSQPGAIRCMMQYYRQPVVVPPNELSSSSWSSPKSPSSPTSSPILSSSNHRKKGSSKSHITSVRQKKKLLQKGSLNQQQGQLADRPESDSDAFPPTLILWGTHGTIWPRELLQLYDPHGKGNNNNVTIVELNAGHWLQQEVPDQVNQHLLDFFRPTSQRTERQTLSPKSSSSFRNDATRKKLVSSSSLSPTSSTLSLNPDTSHRALL